MDVMEMIIQSLKRVKNACEDTDNFSRDTNSRFGTGSIINFNRCDDYQSHRWDPYFVRILIYNMVFN
jgi:hypothetical protein